MEEKDDRSRLYPLSPETMKRHRPPGVQYLDLAPGRRVAYRSEIIP